MGKNETFSENYRVFVVYVEFIGLPVGWTYGVVVHDGDYRALDPRRWPERLQLWERLKSFLSNHCLSVVKCHPTHNICERYQGSNHSSW